VTTREKTIRAVAADTHSPLFRVVVIMLLAFGPRGAGAQTPAGGRQINLEFWSFREGAPQVVESLAQTADGYLWLGTESGLYRFDGVRFERFQSPFGDQLPATDISSLFAPHTGGLWIGYRIGGCFSFLKNGKVIDFKFSSSTGTVNGFAQDRHGIVWAVSTRGVWRFDGSKWQQNPYVWNAQWSAAQGGFDREGVLWALTERKSTEVGRQLFYLLPGGARFQKAGNNLFVEGFTWDADAAILTTHEKRPSGPSSGLELEDSLPAYPILRKNSEQTLDRNNGIWFVSSYDPLFRHPAGASLAEVIGKASRRNSQVYDFDPYRYSRIVDREGSVWIGDMRGVHRFSYSPLMQMQLPKTHGWFTLAPDDAGAVWISSGTGTGESTLYRVAGEKVEFQKDQRGLANFAYRAPDSTLWFAGEGGLWHMAGGRLTRIELPQALSNADNAQFLQAIAGDRSGGMWVSFWNRGLYRFDHGTWTQDGGRHDLPKQRVYIEYRDQLGRIWFGSRNDVLAVLDGEQVQTFGPDDGIRVGEITAIYGRGSEIWIGGELGLQQFDRGRFRGISAANKECLRGVSGIVETSDGDLWLNGLGGVFHIRRTEIVEALKNSAYQVRGERFGRREGLPGLAPQMRPRPTVIEGTDGRLWFTVNNGVVWLDPARSSNKVAPPMVTIQAISADDKACPLDSLIRLPAHTSSVQISYAAVSLSDPEAIRSRYRLRESDQEWHEAGGANSVSYWNLRPGSYQFLVNTSDANGLWSDNTAIADFTVLPAFYQTAWFWTFCGGAFLALLWAAYEFRLRQLQRGFDARIKERVEERTRIARELHDTLLQSVQGLMFSFQAARNLLPGRTEEAMRTLDEAIREGDEAIAEGRTAIQGLRADPALVSNLEDLLTAAGKELARSSRAEGEPPAFRVIVEGARQPLSQLLQDDVYRIAREILRNAFHHAHASRIEAEVAFDRQFLRLRIRDDGKGVDREVLEQGARQGHWGLPGVRERAKRIGARLQLWSELGAGTEAELTVPARIAYGTGHRREGLRLFRKRKVEL